MACLPGMSFNMQDVIRGSWCWLLSVAHVEVALELLESVHSWG